MHGLESFKVKKIFWMGRCLIVNEFAARLRGDSGRLYTTLLKMKKSLDKIA